jgi:hypothetical protein
VRELLTFWESGGEVPTDGDGVVEAAYANELAIEIGDRALMMAADYELSGEPARCALRPSARTNHRSSPTMRPVCTRLRSRVAGRAREGAGMVHF